MPQKKFKLLFNQQTKVYSASWAKYSVIGQEFFNNKTIFILKKIKEHGLLRKSAQELYSDKKILKQFNYHDLLNIITTAVQEQTIEDLNQLEA